MIRYQIFENDVTTAGGIVQRHTGSGQTFIWHGRLASNLGDKINCPACGSIGFIAPKGMRRPFDNMKQAPALNGDLCICKCNPPPVLKNSQTSFMQNVSGGIVINVPKNPLNFSAPSLQQNLNNSLMDDRDQDESYYKWHWGVLLSHSQKTKAQENNSFLKNFSDLHDEYAFGKTRIIYEIDPKAWDGEIAFIDLPKVIQDSIDDPNYTLGKAIAKLAVGQSIDITLPNLSFGKDYLKTIKSKQWPHGRWACDAIGKLTNLGKDKNGKRNFQFSGYLKIKDDLYSWNADFEGYKNLGISAMGEIIRMATGKSTPAPVYTKSKKDESGLPTTYKRHYYFDYYKKGINPPSI